MTNTDRAVLRARAYLELLRREREWHKAECPGYHCCPDEERENAHPMIWGESGSVSWGRQRD